MTWADAKAQSTSRATPRTRRLTLAIAPILACLVGCANSADPPSVTAEATPTTPAVSSSPAPTKEFAMTTLRITVGGRTHTAQLADTQPARNLVEQLPLTLNFSDLNHVEKIAKLPRPLPMDGVPAGADPDVGDIGYYAPSGDLVLYYGDVGYWRGITILGRFDDSDLGAIERQPDGFDVTIERA